VAALFPFAVEVRPRSRPSKNETLTGRRSSRVFTREADATLIQSLRARNLLIAIECDEILALL
jgi:hypothetical protein